MRPRTLLLVVATAAVSAALGITLSGAQAGEPAATSPPARRPAVARMPAEPVAVVHGSQPGTRLGLLSLARSGPKVVTAKVRYVNRGDERWRPDFGTTLLDWTARGFRLIDEVNGREHFPLESADGACLCTGPLEVVEPGQSVDVYAKFPAPPAGVTRVSLHVPTFPSFDDVRIAP